MGSPKLTLTMLNAFVDGGVAAPVHRRAEKMAVRSSQEGSRGAAWVRFGVPSGHRPVFHQVPLAGETRRASVGRA
jgi:hypothetical protein